MKKRMKILTVILAGGLAILLNGCIPSIYPIYTADKLVLLSGLSGEWQQGLDQALQSGNTKKPEHWTFRQGKDKSYLLVHKDEDGHVAAFDVHVVKLGSHYFMDFYPGEMPEEKTSSSIGIMLGNLNQMNNFMELHLLAVHTFAKVELTGNTLKISMFDPDFLSNLLEHQQIRIRHEKTENGYVLTASPTDLQKFAEKYATEKKAFLDEPIELKLKK